MCYLAVIALNVPTTAGAPVRVDTLLVCVVRVSVIGGKFSGGKF